MAKPLLLTTHSELRAWREAVAGRLALVPTMGALHRGHLSLMEAARRRADTVAVSIFVNPTQFGPNEDFARYPRTLDRDLSLCADVGVQAVFAPAVDALYPPGDQTRVRVTELSQGLCGERRPGHFEGVATVVAKLFGLFRPHVAIFGEKDFQQLAVLRAMARDLFLRVEVLGAPIVREPDGLALSSRNAYLSAEARARATALWLGLEAARRRFASGGAAPAALEEAVREKLRGAGLREDYVSLVDPETLRPAEVAASTSRMMVAAYCGATRLIDNASLGDDNAEHAG